MQVIHRLGRNAVRFAASFIGLGLLGALGACGGGSIGFDPPEPVSLSSSAPTPPASSGPSLKSIEVTPNSPQVAVGTSAQLIATGVYTDSSTQDLTTQVTWVSSDDSVATVSNASGSNGLATTATMGSTIVSAASGDVVGETTLLVTDAMLVSIEVSPPGSSAASGLTRQFTAIGHYTDNTTQDLTSQVSWASSDAGVATVSNATDSNGLAIAATPGSTLVTATSGGITGETTLTVTDAVLVSLEVQPASAAVAQGTTRQFTATGLYTDNTTQDLTTQVAWTSSDGSVATVSNTAGSNGLATAATIGSTSVSATAGDVTGEAALTVTDATLVSIEVSPSSASTASGLELQFTATGLYTDNSTQDLTTQVTWASSDDAVATLSNAAGSRGLASAGSAGSATVSATSGSTTGEAMLTVIEATLMSIEVSPATSSTANGSTRQFTATGLYTDGSTEDLTTQVTWTSSEVTIATVSNAPGSKGLASTVSVGNTTVSATSGDVTGDATLTVTDATLVSIEVSPAMPSVANGLTEQFTATGRYSDGSIRDVTAEVLWSSSDGTVATVSNAAGSHGAASTLRPGTTTVAATSGDVTAETTLTVTDATLMWLEISPAMASVAKGSTQQFTAAGFYTDGSTQDLTSAVLWLTPDVAVATVSNAAGSKGLASTVSVGTTTVSATSGDLIAEAALTVTDASLMWIDVSPVSASVASGLTRQFTATGVYTDNSTEDLTAQVLWTSSDAAVASVSNAAGSNGLANTIGVGTATVSATRGAVVGHATLTVTDPILLSIDVSPLAPSVVQNSTQQFTATGTYTDGSIRDVTAQVSWSSSDGSVASMSTIIGSNGLASTGSVGTATIVATSGTVTGETTLTVIPAPPTVDDLVADLLAAVTGVGPGQSLANKVSAVQTYLAVPDLVSACSALADFQGQVASMSGKQVSAAVASELLADAATIETAIPCP
jgi:hypothetical protein